MKNNTYKLSILLISLAFLVSCSQKRVKTGTLEEHSLKNDVWQIVEHPYEGSGNIDDFSISNIDKYNWRYPHKLMEFNKEGYLIRECDIDWDGDINTCIFQRVEDNLLIKESKRDTVKIKIQDNGISAEYFDTIREGVTVEYKQNGDIDLYNIDNNGNKYSIERKLNNNGQILNEYQIDSIGKRHLLFALDYNSNGDVERLKEFSFEKDSLIKETIYSYKYDEHKNWTQKVVFENNEFDVAIRRDIKYYKDCFKDFKRADLIGMWKKSKSERWIEFFDNGKIDIGRGSSIRESGTWEIDEQSRRITFRINDGGTKFNYEFSKCSLVLSDPVDKDDFDIYSKVIDNE